MDDSRCRDWAFGPAVLSAECRGGFDFTVVFEESIFTICPAAIFLLLAPFRVFQLQYVPIRVKKSSVYGVKLVTGVLLSLAQLAGLILVALTWTVRERIALTASVLGFIASLFLLYLLKLEHVRSIRPSFLISAFLLVSILLDVSRVRTEWLRGANLTFAAVITSALSVKAVILSLETVEKRRLLPLSEKGISTESTSGPFNRGFFVWLNGLLQAGFSSLLTLESLPSIYEKLAADKTHAKFNSEWTHCLEIAQPFLIAEAVAFVGSDNDHAPINIGYGLIGAFALVFISTALAIAIYLLANQLGAVCVAPLIVAVTFTTMSGRLGKYVTLHQKDWLESIEKRVNFTSEIFGSIKSVKMLGLAEKMTALIEQMRAEEIAVMKKSRTLWVITVCISETDPLHQKASSSANDVAVHIPQFLSQFLTFTAYAIAAKVSGNQPLSTNQVVLALSLLNVLTLPLALLLESIPMSFTAIGCIQRIQAFLTQESKTERRLIEAKNITTADSTVRGDGFLPSRANQEIEPASIAADMLLSETPQTARISLRDCSFGWNPLPRSQATLTLGRGATDSLVIVIGPVGSGKSTFLKTLIGETYALEGELRLPTARIAYCDQTAWITSGTIRDNIIGESEIRDEEWYSTVIHACDLEPDLSQLSRGDETVVGSKGVKLSGGQKQRIAVARAIYARAQIAIFDDVFSGLDRITEQKVFERVFSRDGLLRRINCTVILSTHSIQHLPEADDIIALGKNGEVVEQGTFAALKNAGGYVQRLKVMDRSIRSSEDAGRGEEAVLTRQITAGIEEPDDPTQTADFGVWKYYANALGWFRIALFILLLSVNSGAGSLSYVWPTRWASANGTEASNALGYWLGTYGALGVVGKAAMAWACFYLYLNVMPRTSKNLHSAVLNAAMNAPMSFLSSIETGVLVNRFSQDMRLVDMILPRAFVGTGFQAFDCISHMGLAIAAVPQLAAAVPFLLGIVWMIQRFYIRTSRQLRLLEIESKAPLFSHFIESLNGLVTIRAFGWTAPYLTKTLALTNEAQRPYYLLLCIQRWLVCVLDLVVAGLAVSIVSLAVALRSRVDPGLLGVSLVMMMTLGHSLAGFVQFFTQLETSLGAITRIKNFEQDMPSELLPDEGADPGDQWPKDGALVFDNVSLSYKPNSAPVVKSVSINLQPTQKFGLVGRTGSGKSSMVLSLLRLVDVSGGVITIDGEDLTTLARPLIRRRLSCLTQEPFIFASTIRLNADPLEENSDDSIQVALERVGLWTVISSKVNPDGSALINPLDALMEENFFSHGQRQLFCLARATLKKSSVLILDEPTSSVDAKTDERMQEVIHTEFKNCTVIMIAHRLDSLVDFDVVAVMDKGALVEIGKPRELLALKDSAFARMYYSGSSGILDT
ncbi:hypothetical protein DL768_001844 [Monosporascus sp. mg162]|nr:hypothetical protein DL768_001844 [Monosporascus sp. mg162]